ncbi:MAG TPA: S53 family peptidase [Rhizomicrobium sp.]|nr:S53 family peptidase [Rhizomicrobium sp.]
MKRSISVAVLASGLAFASVAQAQPIEHSGRIFHMRVCDGQSVAGTARCHAHVVTDGAGNPIRVMVGQGRVLPSTAPAVSGGPYTPAQLRAAYGIAGNGSSGTTVAIVDAYGYPNAASDLTTFRTEFGLGSCTTGSGCLRIVNETGGTRLPRANAGWDEEQALDLDMVSAMCPNCRILLVEANSANFGDLAAAENTAASLGARAIGNSYGGGEKGSTAYASAYSHPGVAITASAGDSGYGVAFPASAPSVTAVGGTSLVWTGSSRTETAWSGTGSGCSTVYGEPSWQSSSKPGMGNNTLCGMRMMNDVSAVADPNTGVIVYMNIWPYAPGFYVFGGTSASAQIISGIYGEKNNGGNPYSAVGSLNDVTSGSDGSCGGTYFCTSVPGYDGPTGLGTPNGDTAF